MIENQILTVGGTIVPSCGQSLPLHLAAALPCQHNQFENKFKLKKKQKNTQLNTAQINTINTAQTQLNTTKTPPKHLESMIHQFPLVANLRKFILLTVKIEPKYDEQWKI